MFCVPYSVVPASGGGLVGASVEGVPDAGVFGLDAIIERLTFPRLALLTVVDLPELVIHTAEPVTDEVAYFVEVVAQVRPVIVSDLLIRFREFPIRERE